MYFRTEKLSVGYAGRVVVGGIDIAVERGRILALIGPNGSGKSTILKTITGQLEEVAGLVTIGGSLLRDTSESELAKRLSVVLTDRINPELMTAYDVVAMGRYPYTGRLGILSEEDREIAARAIDMVGAGDFAGSLFSEISDGQKQRILLARAICQEPEIIVLDEPTSFLDIKHKIELFGVLRRMARENGVAVIMSLHEIDMAFKAADDIACVKDGVIRAYGKPYMVLSQRLVSELYDIDAGAYSAEFGSVELEKPAGAARVFVLAGGGSGVPEYRMLQKMGVPFSTGILSKNDIDYQVAKALAADIASVPAFESYEDAVDRAIALVDACEYFLDTGIPVRSLNACILRLREHALKHGKKIVKSVTELPHNIN